MHEEERHYDWFLQILLSSCHCLYWLRFRNKKECVNSPLYRLFRDLKIRGRDKLRRLPEVNLHNEAYAQKPQTRVLAVLVSSRTSFSLFCSSLENVSILGLFLPTTRHNRFPFQICWPWCFLTPYSSRYLSEIFRNEVKKGIFMSIFCCVLQSRPWIFLSA